MPAGAMYELVDFEKNLNDMFESQPNRLKASDSTFSIVVRNLSEYTLLHKI